MKVAIYARVSTDKQKTDMQLTELREPQAFRGSVSLIGIGAR